MNRYIFSLHIPHVDMKRIVFIDFKATRPGTVRSIHESHTKQLVIVISWPMKHHAGTVEGGNVAIRIACALERIVSPLRQELGNHTW